MIDRVIQWIENNAPPICVLGAIVAFGGGLDRAWVLWQDSRECYTVRTANGQVEAFAKLIDAEHNAHWYVVNKHTVAWVTDRSGHLVDTITPDDVRWGT